MYCLLFTRLGNVYICSVYYKCCDYSNIDNILLNIITLTDEFSKSNQHIGYDSHGMVCIESNIYFGGKIELMILLFGGKNHATLQSSFTTIFIVIKDNIANIERTNSINNINIENDTSIEQIEFFATEYNEKKIKLPLSKDHYNLRYPYFGFNYCIFVNSKNEKVIVTIGGSHPNNRSIFIFNYKTKNLFLKRWVLPIDCTFNPAAIIHNDHIHVAYQKMHCLINLNALCWLVKDQM